jgi:hypothetical protein
MIFLGEKRCCPGSHHPAFPFRPVYAIVKTTEKPMFEREHQFYETHRFEYREKYAELFPYSMTASLIVSLRKQL